MKISLPSLLLLATTLLVAARCQLQNCQNPNYIIPYDPIDTAFDAGIDFIRGKDQLTALIQNPNQQNLKNYALTLAPFAAPLFSMAVLTFILFIATIVQVICFNSCGKQCCGNELNGSTYNVCCMRAMVISFIILAFLAVCIAIAALIVSSDLQKSYNYTSCNTQNIVYQTYNGNNNKSISWSGINNFQSSINLFSVNIQNNVPFLAQYFNSANTAYSQIVDTTAGSSYAGSQTFACQVSASAVSCPFPSGCPSPYQAQFNQQFCNTSFMNSAAYLVAGQMSANSTTWLNNTVALGTVLGTMSSNPQNVQSFVNSVSQFASSIGSYQSSIQSGFSQADSVEGNMQIAFYVFYSFVLAMGVLSLVTVCMVCFCKVFKCRCFMYFYWYIFNLLALLLFINSGFFMGGSIFSQDTCLAYPYYFNNQSNFNQLTFSDPELSGIFKTCFFTKAPSIFTGFSQASILTQFGNLYSQYQAAMPSPQFTTVVTQIENTLTNYKANPNIVVIQNVASSAQPSTALDQLNLLANSSNPSTTQSCKLTNDYFTFDVINCGLFLTNQAVPSNSCNVLFASNINTIVSGRVNQFNSRGCATDGTNYQNRVNALISYGQSIATIVNNLAPIQQSTTPLQNYQTNYFKYYSNVANFYNYDVQQIFNGFFNPYNTLQAGSSCGFVTTSMNGIIDIVCNQLQPYINTFSALNIIQSVIVFLLFILSYFLTTRFEFYEYLEGNFDNFGKNSLKVNEINNVYELNTTDSRNVELLEVNRSQ